MCFYLLVALSASQDRVAKFTKFYFQPQETFILIAHDWGSVVGFYLAQKIPDSISKMVAVDIGPAGPNMLGGGRKIALRTMGSLIGLGLLYQWGLLLAFLLARCLPLVGGFLGQCLFDLVTKFISRNKDKSIPRAKLTVNSAYFYYYFQKESWVWCLQSLLRPPLPTPSLPPSMPCFFAYGKKGLGLFFKVHTQVLKCALSK